MQHNKRKGSLLVEAVVATGFIMLCFFVIDLFPFKFELAKPIKQDLQDFDVYDLHFSGKNIGRNTGDSNIVLVQLGNNRGEIASQIELLKKHQPAVIGVDIIFRDSSEDRAGDSALIESAKGAGSIVWGSLFEYDTSDKRSLTSSFFNTPDLSQRSGYINFIGNKYSVNRTFTPFLKFNDKEYGSFSARILERFAPDRYERLRNRNNSVETINYKGNLESFTNFSAKELNFYDETGQLEPKIRGKIVLLGFFNKEGSDVLEDLHFTPLNERVSGRSFPDMYGVVVHANIISMLLEKRYIQTKSALFSYLLSVLFTFLFTLYIFSRYGKKAHPSHLLFILIQIVLIILLTWLFLLLFSHFNIKVNLLPIIITMALSVEMIVVYQKLARWLHKKWNYPTLFSKQ